MKFIGNLFAWLKSLPVIILLVLVFAAALVFRVSASHIGTSAGEASGAAVGTALGSFDGITEGISAGAEDGREAGLSAEDTKAVIQSSLAETGQLQILSAGIKLTNQHEVGDQYKALYIMKGTAVFSVDLRQASISVDSAGISVVCPAPEAKVYIDDDATEKLAEYQKHRFSGSAEDGFQAYLNTMARSKEEILKSISNYDSLMEQARESAVRQITTLTHAVRGAAADVNISFAS